ncbi:hypothetical protein BH23CHL2_BH23CHL2_10590 [soil metagenome]
MTTVKVPTTLTATELARNLSDILSRIHYGGERFLIVRNGTPVATLGPPNRELNQTVNDFVDVVKQLPRLGPGFADDIDAIISNQSKSEPPAWG